MRDKEPGDWLFKVVPIFIVAAFVLVLCAWIAIGVLGVRALNALSTCTPAVITQTHSGQTTTSIGCKR